jgi:hypothetical protein
MRPPFIRLPLPSSQILRGAFAASALAVAACSSEGSGVGKQGAPAGNKDAGHGDDQADTGGMAPGKKDATPAPQCRGPGYAGSPSQQRFSHLSAIVVDGAGKPVSKVIAQACGTNICLNGTTGADGSVTIEQAVSMTKPAFKYGDGTLYARFALPLEDPSVNVDLGKEVTFLFDAPEMGVALEPGKPAVSHGATVTLSPETTDVTPDRLDFYTADLRKFRAVEVPIAKAPAAVDPSFGFELVYALTPSDTVLCPAAALSVPNTPGWDAGSRVEVFLHGIDVAEEWAPYGGWAKVSGGAVSADGTSISTDADGGIPALSVIGIRLAK